MMSRNPSRSSRARSSPPTPCGADRVVVAVQGARSSSEVAAPRRPPSTRSTAAGWADGVELDVVEGPERVPVRRGDGAARGDRRAAARSLGSRRRTGTASTRSGDDAESAGGVEMAGPCRRAAAPPTLVNNVETIANVARASWPTGADWFRAVGTTSRPAPSSCTVSGQRPGARRRRGRRSARRCGEVIERSAAAPGDGRRSSPCCPGVANPLVPADLLDTPLTYEDMAGVGSGLGAGRVHRVRRQRPTSPPSPPVSPASSPSSRAGSARRASRTASPSPSSSAACCRRRARRRRPRRRSPTASARSSTAPAASSPTSTSGSSAACSSCSPTHFGPTSTGGWPPPSPTSIAPIVDIVGERRRPRREPGAPSSPTGPSTQVDSGKSPVERLAAGGPDDPT